MNRLSINEVYRNLVYYYLVYFLLLDILIGASSIYFDIGGMSLIHPGHIIRGVILIGLISYVLNLNSDYTYERNIAYLSIIYFLSFVIIIGLYNNNLFLTIEELYTAIRPLFIILLAVYIFKNSTFFRSKIDYIIKVNFIILTVNLVFGYVTGFGYETYSFLDNTTKGFLIAGNSASILSIVFFAYFLFNNNINYKYIYCIICILNMVMLGTKAIFITPILLYSYLIYYIINNKKERIVNIALSTTLIIGILIILGTAITDLISNRYMPLFQRMGILELTSLSISELALSYRRTYYAFEQLSYQLSNIQAFIFGVGAAGQIEFWGTQTFKFSAMDFVDLLFKYGILSVILIGSIIFKSLRNIYSNTLKINLRIVFLLILLYSFFGGYVMFDLTSGTMFALFLGLTMR